MFKTDRAAPGGQPTTVSPGRRGAPARPAARDPPSSALPGRVALPILLQK
ncbi:hypothetical protein [Chitiniphilus shinanonensis]